MGQKENPNEGIKQTVQGNVYPNSSTQYPVNEQQSFQYPMIVQPHGSTQPVNNIYSRPAKSHLTWSIINTLCCCCVGQWILFCSIPALIFSARVRSNQDFNLYQEAEKYSKTARILNVLATIGMVFVLFCITAYITFIGYVVISVNLANNFANSSNINYVNDK